MDFLCGDLDRIFTALFEMGRVEPLLHRDWKALYRLPQVRWPEVAQAIRQLNEMSNLLEMRRFLETLPYDVVDALIIEVARELADFQNYKAAMH